MICPARLDRIPTRPASWYAAPRAKVVSPERPAQVHRCRTAAPPLSGFSPCRAREVAGAGQSAISHRETKTSTLSRCEPIPPRRSLPDPGRSRASWTPAWGEAAGDRLRHRPGDTGRDQPIRRPRPSSPSTAPTPRWPGRESSTRRRLRPGGSASPGATSSTGRSQPGGFDRVFAIREQLLDPSWFGPAACRRQPAPRRGGLDHL